MTTDCIRTPDDAAHAERIDAYVRTPAEHAEHAAHAAVSDAIARAYQAGHDAAAEAAASRTGLTFTRAYLAGYDHAAADTAPCRAADLAAAIHTYRDSLRSLHQALAAVPPGTVPAGDVLTATLHDLDRLIDTHAPAETPR